MYRMRPLLLLAIATFSIPCFAGNIYTFYSHVSGTYSLEVNRQHCLAEFSLTKPIYLSDEVLAKHCQSQSTCSIVIYKGQDCQKEKAIGRGYTELETGQIWMENLDSQRYFFKTQPFSLGLHPKYSEH